jgi:hypothetical protein
MLTTTGKGTVSGNNENTEDYVDTMDNESGVKQLVGTMTEDKSKLKLGNPAMSQEFLWKELAQHS